MKTVSVIIPAYNSEETIAQCLLSVLNQKEKVTEIVIVDDGSIDSTVEIVKKLIVDNSTYIQIKLILQKNAGPSRARNIGVENATSEYVAFLDSDDEWLENHIFQVKRLLCREKHYKIVCTKYLSGTFSKYGEVNFKQTLYRNYFVTPCVVVDRAAFLSCGGFDEEMKYCEDYKLFLNLNYNYGGYIIDYMGAKNIQDKRPFGDKGLSGNLKKMHLGVLKCYNDLYSEEKIGIIQFYKARIFATLKYYRRILHASIRS